MKSLRNLCILVILAIAGVLLQPFPGVALAADASSNSQVAIPDAGWNLWLDKNASWQTEPAYLPGEAGIEQIAVRPPTGGWSALSHNTPVSVTLPTTVEQHFWGADGLRPYNNEYFYEKQDPAPKNGNYIGVSWWWRSVPVPQSFAGKTAILHIRGAKQRAEVYVNEKLVGYGFIAETAFDCDVTKALQPGRVNQIAIRITNPGGRLDWGDWGTAQFGKIGFYAGHAFGGLDRGITLTAHGPVRIADSWVLNTSQPRAVTAHAELTSTLPSATQGIVRATVLEIGSETVVAQSQTPVTLSPGKNASVSIPISAPKARLWDLQHPNLYRLRLDYLGTVTDRREVRFGFRWFAPTGVGSHAVLRLNGSRIRVYSAISWGFWGMNGLWPTPMLAEKEVRVAKQLGLNALNFHRNIARTEALDTADRLGLLRYTEPGGGMTLFWDKTRTDNTLQRYMTEKIVRMVRDHRSHPSLIAYVVQNELDDDTFHHPLAATILRRIHAEDPSRPAILKSGLGPKGEMWMMPYDDTIHQDTGDGYSGWSDEHTVGTPDSWQDSNYQGPNNFVYRNTNEREIVDYGEMGGSGTGDNHPRMLQQIKALGGKSYDRIDHEEVTAAYEQFLDRYNFRPAFPTVTGLFDQIGAKQYEYWQNVLQCARLSDANDYLTVSGWESTAIENHSGIVDALRNPHGNPAVIAAALRPVLPALQLYRTSAYCHETIPFDLYFLNETNHPIAGNLKLTLRRPDGKEQTLGTYPVPTFRTDQFSYSVATNGMTPPLDMAGNYQITFSLGSASETRTIYVVDLPKLPTGDIALQGSSSRLQQDLAAIGAVAKPFESGGHFGLAICTADQSGTTYHSDTPAQGTPDPELYQTQRYGKADEARLRFAGLPNGPAKVTLGFVEPYFTKAGSRVFDVVVNGKTVLPDLDIFAQAGGKDRVWTTTLDATIADGQVVIAPGNIKADNASFHTIRIEAGGKTVAVYFGAKPYTAHDGTVWQPYTPTADLPEALLAQVRAGMSLLVISDNDDSTEQYAKALAAAGAFRYTGLVGRSFAPWMGSWYFVRKHPLYEGLPVNTVMKGDYQVGVSTANGLQVEGPAVEIVTAYSKDHSRVIGAGDVVTRLGKGQIVFHTLPPMNPVFQRRWLNNSIRFLAKNADRALMPQAVARAADTPLTIDASAPLRKVSPLHYGLMTEEINHSYDGGLYAELVQNGAFLDNAKTPQHWSVVAGSVPYQWILLDSVYSHQK